MSATGGISDLGRSFAEEFRERFLRAEPVLARLKCGHAYAECLDILYQEFDSLHGAARAMNFMHWERFCWQVAIYARFLRNHRAENMEADYSLLSQCIRLGLQCVEQPESGQARYAELIGQLIAGMEARIDASRPGRGNGES